MPGTGKKGYTGASLYGGGYNISNGIIQSGSGGSSSGASGTGTSPKAIAEKIQNAVSNGVNNATNYVSSKARANAANIANIAGTDSSDYGDYIRQLMEVSQNNTAMSQQFAREQMEYQRQSDATAMAWSANEAEKNRQWQERLANTAHQREVQDLVAAGLNPILSANQGAYTGSGATGQAFSSNGAMGTVDNSLNSALGSLFNTAINTASQAAIAGLYTNATKYQSDMQYAASKMQAEASIFNNNNNINANKAINAMNNDAALQRANISSAATLGAAGISAGAIKYGAEQAAAASMYHSDQALAGQKDYNEKYYQASTYNTRQGGLNTRYTADRNQENVHYQVDNGSIYSVGGLQNIAGQILDVGALGAQLLGYMGWN